MIECGIGWVSMWRKLSRLHIRRVGLLRGNFQAGNEIAVKSHSGLSFPCRQCYRAL
jgi:hypothetical protein